MKSVSGEKLSWGYKVGCISVIVLLGVIIRGQNIAADSANISFKPEVKTILVGESAVVTAPWPAVRVAITDPEIADVKVLTPEQILLQGIKTGSTDLIVWSEDEKQVWQWKVRVRMDVGHFQEKLDELFPLSSLEVNQSGEVLIVGGFLRRAEQAAQLHSFLDEAKITYVDMTSVAGVQQVQLQVRVAEVSRTALRALTINTLYADEDFWGGITISSSSGTPLVSSVDVGPDFSDALFSPAVTIFGGVESANFETFLEALAENQYLRILANPTLVALSGEEASFLAGGEFPVPIVQGVGGGTSITVEYKEFGVRLVFRPVVLGDGTIRLHASQEVSDLTDFGAVVIEGFRVPALVTRQAETTLELHSGQTFAMAGLIQHKTEAIKSRVPWLGDVPVLGALFRSVRYEKNETELVMLVTASLVEPMSVGTKPPVPGLLHSAPNDWELYLEGRIEGKEPARIDPNDAEWLKQMGLDRLMGPGTWDSYDQVTPSDRAGIVPDPNDPNAGAADVQDSRTSGTTRRTHPPDVAGRSPTFAPTSEEERTKK
jgi:pilus assembly protein CpaC